MFTLAFQAGLTGLNCALCDAELSAIDAKDRNKSSFLEKWSDLFYSQNWYVFYALFSGKKV